MGNHDTQSVRTEADILARQSRPQRNSTWIPKTRDWRYATGVIQHDDFQDAPKSRSVWDTMDYEYQASGSLSGSLSGSGSGSGSELAMDGRTENVLTPNSTTSKMSTESPRSRGQLKPSYKPMSPRKRTWMQVTMYKRNDSPSDDAEEASYQATSLKVRLQFTGRNKKKVQGNLEQAVALPPSLSTPECTSSPDIDQTPTPPVSAPNTPATARTAETLRTPHMLGSIESLHTFPLFERTWVDETYDFNVATARSTLRNASAEVEELGANYTWYADAVPVDAMFPPGVPLSAKEVNAYYPHHVRWKGVMLRLTNNDYRGADIIGMQTYFRGPPAHHATAAYMNGYQRDAVKSTIPGFKTATYKGKPDRNLRTDDLSPGHYIESRRRGFALPTFNDLVRGLQYVPSGLDARGLTQCLSWYLNFRDSFKPKLELNVLHTQSLIRALRLPLKPYGPQNLDRNALQEWRNKGKFEELKVEDVKRNGAQTVAGSEHYSKTQLRLNLDEDDVTMNLTLPIRHVLTFPFLALHGVVGEALKVGIVKAEIRRAGRKEENVKRALETKGAARLAGEYDSDAAESLGDDVEQDNTKVETEKEEPKQSDRIPKRPCAVEQSPDYSLLPRMKKARSALRAPQIPSGPRVPPRRFAPAPARPYASSYSQNTAHLGRSLNAPPPSSAYVPPQDTPASSYGRRDHQAQQLYPRSGPTNPNARLYAQGREYYHTRARRGYRGGGCGR